MSAPVENVALAIVVMAGLALVGVAIVALARPALARRFFLGFARSAGAHFAEMAARIVVGAALIIASPQMLFSTAFFWFGAALLVSSTLLLCLPWTWHRTFGERVLPSFVRFLSVVGSIAFLLGGMLVVSAIAGAS